MLFVFRYNLRLRYSLEAGLLLKFAKILKCKTTVQLINNMFSDRKFKVSLNGSENNYKYLQNGLPQGFVLSPILFNAYTADITETTARRFTYADDVGLVTQAKIFEELEETLSENFDKV